MVTNIFVHQKAEKGEDFKEFVDRIKYIVVYKNKSGGDSNRVVGNSSRVFFGQLDVL